MIEFAALPMLLSLAAAVLPYLLLRNRVRAKRTIEWPNNRLLQQVIQRQAKKLNWLQWLLLALRTLAVIAIGLAVANPFLKSDRMDNSGMDQQTRMHVYVIDISPSMTLQPQSSEKSTLLDRAESLVRSSVASLPKYDLVALLVADRSAEILFLGDSRDSQQFNQSLKNVTAGTTSVDVDSLVIKLQQLLVEGKRRAANLQQVDFTVLSDLSQHDWSTQKMELLQSSLNDLEDDIKSFVDFKGLWPPNNSSNKSAEVIENLTIRDTKLIQQPLKQETCKLVATIANTGTEPKSSVPVQLWLDNQMKEEKLLSTLPAGSSATIEFECEQLDRLERKAELRIPTDQLLIDNSRYAVIPAQVPKRAVVIAPNAEQGVGLVAASRALGLQVNARSKFEVASLKEPTVIHIVDPDGKDAAMSQSIQAALRKGDRVLLWLGPSLASPDSIAESFREWLPGERALVKQWSSNELASIVEASSTNTANEGSLQIPIEKYWAMEKVKPNWSTTFKLDNGEAFVWSKQFQQGTIVCIATPPLLTRSENNESAWNEMAKWPSFVTLLDKLLRKSTMQSELQVFAGQPYAIVNQVNSLNIKRPDETLRMISTNSDMTEPIYFRETAQLGFYEISSDIESALIQTHLFASNLDPSEVQFKSAEVPESFLVDAVGGQSKANSSGGLVGIFRWLLTIAIVLLLAESCLLAFAYSRRRLFKVGGADQ